MTTASIHSTGKGDMGPIIHGDIVNQKTTAFIQRQAMAGNRKGYARAA